MHVLLKNKTKQNQPAQQQQQQRKKWIACCWLLSIKKNFKDNPKRVFFWTLLILNEDTLRLPSMLNITFKIT